MGGADSRKGGVFNLFIPLLFSFLHPYHRLVSFPNANYLCPHFMPSSFYFALELYKQFPYKRNHMMFKLACLMYFTQHYGLEMHVSYRRPKCILYSTVILQGSLGETPASSQWSFLVPMPLQLCCALCLGCRASSRRGPGAPSRGLFSAMKPRDLGRNSLPACTSTSLALCCWPESSLYSQE